MSPSEVLDRIFEFPGIYIGHESVDRTQYFVSGYICALQQIGANSEDHFQERFSAFVCRRFGYTPTTHGWASICTFHGINDAGAFELAKKLWGEYKAEMNQTPYDDRSQADGEA